jgi:hypothetical protein
MDHILNVIQIKINIINNKNSINLLIKGNKLIDSLI